MASGDTNSWTGIREELLRRIHDRIWEPGAQIPHEADLAEEFGCARTTVNRALRDLAESGLVVRKRRAGTRVALNPPQRATLRIPILREQVESGGQAYRHELLHRELRPIPPVLNGAFQTSPNDEALFLRTLHLADEKPYAIEERHINLATVPAARERTFEKTSANEWLVHNAPYTHGELSFSAINADPTLAEILQSEEGVALFEMERTTWTGDASITHVRLVYAPGFRMHSSI